MADTALSASAKCVAGTLLLKFHNTKTGQCNPSFAAIAKATGRSRRAIFPAITELRDGGWITVESTKGGSSTNTNRFKFNFEPVSSTTPPPVKPASPVKQNAGGVKPAAHEPSRTTTAFGGGVGEEISPRRAPGGAAEEFEELRRLWQRPYGMNEAKALAAFNRVTRDVPPAHILESARRWVAAREPAYLPPLERWLDDGAWRNDPPARRSHSQRKPSAAEVAAGLAAASRGEGRGW